MQLYLDRFNPRDWDGVRELITADARLSAAERFTGRLVDAPYFAKYELWPVPWKLEVGQVDGEPVVIILQCGADTWTPHSAVRLDVVGQGIERIVDYRHCPWVIPAAASVSLAGPS
jgi:RNA polymerase sigma-70 factor (ECF subfamily)